MNDPNQLMRWGGVLGVGGVVLFVAGLLLGSGSFIATEVTLAEPDFASNIPQPSPLMLEIATLLGYGLAPLAFLLLCSAYHHWMHAQGYPLAGWVYVVGVLGYALWLIGGGGIEVLIAPGIRTLDRPDANTIGAVFKLASGGLIDLAYLLVGLHLVFVGRFVQKNTPQHATWGGAAVFTGASIIPIIIAGPYQTLNFFGIYAVGAPLVGIFALAVVLLRQSEKVAAA